MNKHTYESLYMTIKEQYSRRIKEEGEGEGKEQETANNIKMNDYYNKLFNVYNNPSAANINEIIGETIGIKREENKDIDNSYVYLSLFKER